MEVTYTDQQLIRIQAEEETEAAIIDLVGDLATYNPSSKIVIFEGGGDTEFDQHFVRQLFPEFALQVTLISGENKFRVVQLQNILHRARLEGKLKAAVFSVVDRDSDRDTPANSFQKSWDVYHIENYLLDSNIISNVLNDISPERRFTSKIIEGKLESCARKSQNEIVLHELRQRVHLTLSPLMEMGCDPALPPEQALSAALSRAVQRINDVHRTALSTEALQALDGTVRASLEKALAEGTWKDDFRGRVILKALLQELRIGLKYEMFRNLLVSKMRDIGVQPAGMARVIQEILDA